MNCDKKFLRKQHLENHMLSKHNKNNDTVIKNKCKDCEK